MKAVNASIYKEMSIDNIYESINKNSYFMDPLDRGRNIFEDLYLQLESSLHILHQHLAPIYTAIRSVKEWWLISSIPTYEHIATKIIDFFIVYGDLIIIFSIVMILFTTMYNIIKWRADKDIRRAFNCTKKNTSGRRNMYAKRFYGRSSK